VEDDQPSTGRLSQRLVWLGCGAAGVILLAGVATRLMARPSEPAPAPARAELPPHWSTAQVEELIAGIQDARKVGLEPKDYGLAALRGELDRRGGPSLAAGSVQLDRLAETSAVNLAEDLSRRGMADHGQIDWRAHEPRASARLVAALHTALAQGRLREWLHGLRAPSPRTSPSGSAAPAE
jgi:hypothetical protein